MIFEWIQAVGIMLTFIFGCYTLLSELHKIELPSDNSDIVSSLDSNAHYDIIELRRKSNTRSLS